MGDVKFLLSSDISLNVRVKLYVPFNRSAPIHDRCRVSLVGDASRLKLAYPTIDGTR